MIILNSDLKYRECLFPTFPNSMRCTTIRFASDRFGLLRQIPILTHITAMFQCSRPSQVHVTGEITSDFLSILKKRPKCGHTGVNFGLRASRNCPFMRVKLSPCSPIEVAPTDRIKLPHGVWIEK